jgi:hypothetical protein
LRGRRAPRYEVKELLLAKVLCVSGGLGQAASTLLSWGPSPLNTAERASILASAMVAVCSVAVCSAESKGRRLAQSAVLTLLFVVACIPLSILLGEFDGSVLFGH